MGRSQLADLPGTPWVSTNWYFLTRPRRGTCLGEVHGEEVGHSLVVEFEALSISPS